MGGRLTRHDLSIEQLGEATQSQVRCACADSQSSFVKSTETAGMALAALCAGRSCTPFICVLQTHANLLWSSCGTSACHLCLPS